MRRQLLLLVTGVLSCGILVGCGSGEVAKPVKPVAKSKKAPPPRTLATPAELLKKPRKELAKLCDELLEELQRKERLRIEEGAGYALLTDVRVPLFVPVYREATYSKTAGMSLPPYLLEGTSDSVVALHLARHGDVEAALKLVDPADKAALSAIEAYKTEQNYPLEWSRLVGMMQHGGQLSLAGGNVEGANELLAIHRQLGELNSDRFPTALRAALLPRGKALLRKAADSWKKGANAELAAEINAQLVKWPITHPPVVLPPRSTRENVCRLFGVEASGRAVMAAHPFRGLDLLALPVPSQDVEAVTAFLDGYDRLQEILITYEAMPPDITMARQFGLHLENWRASEADAKTNARCWHRLGEINCELMLIGRNAAVGGIVRLMGLDMMPNGIELPRDFGVLHLSGTFEHNRVGAALPERASQLVLSRADVLARIANPVPVLPLDHVKLVRNTTEDVLEEISFDFARSATAPKTLAKMALPLFETAGAPQLRTNGKDVTLHWEDAETRYALNVPELATKTVNFKVMDTGSAKDRYQRARAWDLAERKKRIEANEPRSRLPRELNGVQLGMTRKQVSEEIEKLPGGKRFDVAGGEKHLWSGPSADLMQPMLRELFVYYGAEDKAYAMRARYEFGPRTSPDMMLTPIRKVAGAPLPLPRAGSVWADLTQHPGSTVQQWQDDLTLLTSRRDDAAVELILRDCPLAHPDSAPLLELAYLARGPDRVTLGIARKDLYAAWAVREPAMVNGAALFTPPENSPYDAILVWFSNDKSNDRVTRVVARHRPDERKLTTNAQASLAVREAWTKNMNDYGWPWRQDFLPGNTLLSWGHNDDRTRVRIFWQESAQGRQIFTEWMHISQ